jgi:hypothetical protein
MINEVTESLEAFLKQPGLPPPLRDAAIRFDRPTDPYSIDQATVNLYLYEIKENLELRNNEPVLRRVGNTTFIDKPPYRVNCMYLVTAWPVDGVDLPQQEHLLLSQVLQLIAGTPTLPATFLTPALLLQEPPLPMLVVQPDGVRNPAEFWAAIGNRLKPSLLLSVTVGLAAFPSDDFPAIISSQIQYQAIPSGAALDAALFRIGGKVTDAVTNPVANAAVRVLEPGRSTTTDPAGQFTVSALPAGNFTLRVTAGALTKDRAITVPAAAPNDYNVQLT